MNESVKVAEFVVRSSLSLTGRGTCVVGFIKSGLVHTGDEVRWTDDGGERVARVAGISSIREVSLREPPSIGLMVAGAEPSDFVEGSTLSIWGWPTSTAQSV